MLFCCITTASKRLWIYSVPRSSAVLQQPARENAISYCITTANKNAFAVLQQPAEV
jgi:hypothetical protein